LIRSSFSGDDDGDDLIHEISHVLLECDGGNDCLWNDND
jgi:hypothetical protein